MSENILQNPFVIQCKDCSLIVGDSFSLLDFKKNHLIFSTLSINTILQNEEKESTNTFDYKCQYKEVKCKCGNIIGTKYSTVNDNIKDLFNKHCIDRSKVFSYQLGCNVEVAEQSLSSLAEEVSKLQKLFVYLHNKVEKNKK